ncbi:MULTISPECIES: DUF4136 domain-containing protein [Sphingomonadales]|uniref:DUF4136 domain-containing protein n=2 Tax=Edaphosphingomonas TaxID=3423724 RepID=A0A2T4I0T1_9SPHN|nr:MULTISPECIES: DUF4136 domain-containing protein [Sphingomonas]AGH50471.1 hypothetical protein G432_13765 [Sphingomonas sp. MM-1]MDX3886292.1 DUF4136 domain-containing protein [Sphingomonas sp.]OHT18905.1 hypothetical protein BHE75_00885 [Sphingomonas haloaromaticamans]PTD22511.1 DUF4136 domain-containing protein [Sphingomonas fennica]
MSLRRLVLSGFVLTLVAGCASQVPPVQVTRFHLGQPIARGEIVVEPRDPTLANSLEFRSQAEAVSAELARLNFRLAPGIAKSELVAVVDVTRRTRRDADTGSGVSVGLGGGSYGGGVGVGGGVSFPIGKSKSRDVDLTELAVQIKRRSEGTVIWEGRARSEARAGTPGAAPAAAVQRLAAALFKDFPGESGRVVTVK